MEGVVRLYPSIKVERGHREMITNKTVVMKDLPQMQLHNISHASAAYVTVGT